MLVGIHSLYSEEKTDTKPPPELWGSVFYGNIFAGNFFKGDGGKEKKDMPSY